MTVPCPFEVNLLVSVSVEPVSDLFFTERDLSFAAYEAVCNVLQPFQGAGLSHARTKDARIIVVNVKQAPREVVDAVHLQRIAESVESINVLARSMADKLDIMLITKTDTDKAKREEEAKKEASRIRNNYYALRDVARDRRLAAVFASSPPKGEQGSQSLVQRDRIVSAAEVRCRSSPAAREPGAVSRHHVSSFGGLVGNRSRAVGASVPSWNVRHEDCGFV